MPDGDLINTRFMNYFDQNSGNRCETGVSVPCDTVINLAPNLVEKVIAKHRNVLYRPYQPYCELRG